MALSKSALSELLDALRAGGDLDVIREGLALVLQALIDAEAAQQIGADRYERSASRTTHRNGSRSRLLSTKAGDVELRIPKLREGSFFPALLEPRRRIDRALLAVVMEAYVPGTSTRKVDDLVRALGVDAGISKSEVSRICGELDAEVAAFRSRPLAHTAFPYVFVDATYLKARVNGRVVSRAVVIATGVTADGGREVLGLDVGDSEDGAFWTAFLRSLKARGLAGVQAGHLRRPHRPQGRHRRGHGRRLMAALPSPLPAQRARPGATRLGRDGRGGHPHHLRPAHRPRSRGPGRQGRGHARRKVPGRGVDADRCPRGPDRLRVLPTGALGQDLEHEPVGAGQQGDQAQNECRRDLSR
jgi:putative transposase